MVHCSPSDLIQPQQDGGEDVCCDVRPPSHASWTPDLPTPEDLLRSRPPRRQQPQQQETPQPRAHLALPRSSEVSEQAEQHNWMKTLTLHQADLTFFFLYSVRFQSSKSGKIYLHRDIRLLFSRKSMEVDSGAAYELQSFTESPIDPPFSPRC